MNTSDEWLSLHLVDGPRERVPLIYGRGYLTVGTACAMTSTLYTRLIVRANNQRE
jgi:hypothetical protein